MRGEKKNKRKRKKKECLAEVQSRKRRDANRGRDSEASCARSGTLTVKDFLHQPPLAPGHALRRSEQVVKIGEGTFSLISHLGDGKGSPRKGEPKSPALAAVAGASSSSGS